ncbi:hypothetical protein J2X09_004561 [Hydrogenophaga laconesensis]|uniref:Uncharacterized protein n=1 Tax=Hydrogenophaga laconesensis TaxID=1805971 RepID=A0ABU1VH48_9BURK|nr:hypothetical protein [Hydrogenophaga laconesensis]
MRPGTRIRDKGPEQAGTAIGPPRGHRQKRYKPQPASAASISFASFSGASCGA